MKINWDALGISVAVLCAIHCAFLPLIITVFPLFFGKIFENELFEFAMILCSFLIGFYQFYRGIKKHKHFTLPVYIFIVGFLILTFKFFSSSNELKFILPGAFLIILAHTINFIYCQKKDKPHHSKNGHHCHDEHCKH